VQPGLAILAAALAVVGSTAGCMVLFYLSRKGGERYLDRHTDSGRTRKFRELFLRYGLVTVFIPTLLPLPLPTKIFVISAGAFGVRWLPFLLVVLVARVPRYFGLAYLGSQLGENSGAWLRGHAWHLAGVALAMFALSVLLIRLAERSRKAAVGLG
jgi:uncharacterized membrane protein YdjX (TVP38/TMEM64 family)